MARFFFWIVFGAMGLVTSLVASCCLLQYIVRVPLGSRPMFHILNTEKIRSFAGGPDWHIGHRYLDKNGNRIYIDDPLNLILVVDEKGDHGPVCKPDSVTFLPGTERQYTVPARTNAILIYSHGTLVAESVLSEKGTEKFCDEWWRQYQTSGRDGTDIQEIFNTLGYDVSVPIPDPNRFKLSSP
ncbi:MAG: hypothetical protein JWP89_5306 [Schlesneria sp.]|nr:hypothetical protein [Schlesneria sp.]